MEKNSNTNISRSKAKREAKRRQNEKIRRQRLIYKVTGITISVVVLLLIVWVVGKQIYLMAIRTAPNSDYSAGLTNDGKIEDIDVLSALSLVDYDNISIPENEVNATEEEVDEEINSMLDEYKELSTDSDIEIADGDEVNIDYVGTVDGVEFEGGSSEGSGYDLTIGSGTFIDDFEEQLIGHRAGENVAIEVTFPEDYRNEDLAGKDANFAVTINGVMVSPELSDEFVEENLADIEEVSTVAEYRAKIEKNIYAENLEEYLTDYIVENSTVNSYPKKYLKSIKSINKYNDGMGNDIEDEIEYEKELTERAKEDVKEAMVYQAIFESAGLTIDMDAYYNELNENNGEDYASNIIKTYGEGYIAQMEMREAVVDYLIGLYSKNN